MRLATRLCNAAAGSADATESHVYMRSISSNKLPVHHTCLVYSLLLENASMDVASVRRVCSMAFTKTTKIVSLLKRLCIVAFMGFSLYLVALKHVVAMPSQSWGYSDDVEHKRATRLRTRRARHAILIHWNRCRNSSCQRFLYHIFLHTFLLSSRYRFGVHASS
jgi:hypothetical protein